MCRRKALRLLEIATERHVATPPDTSPLDADLEIDCNSESLQQRTDGAPKAMMSAPICAWTMLSASRYAVFSSESGPAIPGVGYLA
ncbi:hypothetical protein NDU88_007663 [Pleurodeles waltl]|uniref:Uncharacterized protein n=1 Tax=Pleurodeles waltl TaxID=8319 RepID=A0AAV7PPM8_PLEWA|nr:hypothetical protein NDU88_007663 [Pleurodeles waltl]